MKHIVSRMSSYFPNRWSLSYLNLIKNMKTSMKVTWLRRFILTNSPWQSIIKDCINFNEFFSCGTSYLQSVLHKIKNKFWTDVLTAYIDLTDKNTVDNEDALLSSPIFYSWKYPSVENKLVQKRYHTYQ